MGSCSPRSRGFPLLQQPDPWASTCPASIAAPSGCSGVVAFLGLDTFIIQVPSGFKPCFFRSGTPWGLPLSAPFHLHCIANVLASPSVHGWGWQSPAAACFRLPGEEPTVRLLCVPGEDGSPVNFPQPRPFASAIPGHRCPGTAEEAIHSFMCEGTPGGNSWKQPRKDIPSLAGKWPARLAGDGLLSVPVAGRDSSGPAWKKKMCVCVFIFSSALSLGGCEGCAWLVRARRSCRTAPALVGVAVFARVVFPPPWVFAPRASPRAGLVTWAVAAGCGGGLPAARDGWMWDGMAGYRAGLLEGRAYHNP